MIELPPGWEDLTAKGIVAFGVLMIFLGWLIPKRTHEREMRDKDETIARQAKQLDESLENNSKLTAAVQNLVVAADTSAHALRQVAKEAENIRAKGGDE